MISKVKTENRCVFKFNLVQLFSCCGSTVFVYGVGSVGLSNT